MRKLLSSLVLTAGIAATSPVLAMEVEGVEVAESLSNGGTELNLVGAGVRNKFFIDLYVGSLYSADASADVINGDVPAAIQLDIISGLITPEKMMAATNEGFEAATDGNTAPIQADIDNFMTEFSTVKEGDNYKFVNVPGTGLEVYINGKKTKTIANPEFKKALFAIWLGEEPAQDSLKEDMLGE